MVEIGAQGMQGEVNAFAISKGGVWVVPRGESFPCVSSRCPSNARRATIVRGFWDPLLDDNNASKSESRKER